MEKDEFNLKHVDIEDKDALTRKVNSNVMVTNEGVVWLWRQTLAKVT